MNEEELLEQLDAEGLAEVLGFDEDEIKTAIRTDAGVKEAAVAVVKTESKEAVYQLEAEIQLQQIGESDSQRTVP